MARKMGCLFEEISPLSVAIANGIKVSVTSW